VKLQYIIALAVVLSTSAAYFVFFLLGRRWRRVYEEKGVSYWTAPKEQRVKEFTDDFWQPRLVTVLYGLAYFTNGYSRTCFTLWAPIFLLQIRKLSVVDAALFTGLIYMAWSWKMFIGLASDALPIKWRGTNCRRLPWFLISGVLYLMATMVFILFSPDKLPIWTALLPAITAVITAGAIYDATAGAYVVDVVPPSWHARVLGAVNTIGRSSGGVLACILPPLLLRLGGYQLVFLSAGISGMTAFACLLLREPQLILERVFNRQAIAFTFTEKAVLIASIFHLSQAFSLRRMSNPLGGLFSFIVQDVVGASPDLVGKIGVVILLGGVPGSLIGGWAADKWGHKRIFTISSVIIALSGLLWVPIQRGMVNQFVVVAIISSILNNIVMSSMLALAADMTPLALSATVFQMYMSLLWVSNVPVSITTGLMLDINLATTMIVTSVLSLAPLIVVKFVKTYEASKGTDV
jgi:MFS family permease